VAKDTRGGKTTEQLKGSNRKGKNIRVGAAKGPNQDQTRRSMTHEIFMREGKKKEKGRDPGKGTAGLTEKTDIKSGHPPDKKKKKKKKKTRREHKRRKKLGHETEEVKKPASSLRIDFAGLITWYRKNGKGGSGSDREKPR